MQENIKSGYELKHGFKDMKMFSTTNAEVFLSCFVEIPFFVKEKSLYFKHKVLYVKIH